ncbi:ABC transporter ATP-binding protein [Arcanobacterium haemolyticum]|nr:ABC transporter ATP-binding protein [Arcanobacterium haemolyticum]
MSTTQHAAPLTAHKLTKTFGAVRALAGVDITIPVGQSLAIMGPSGSGKSTLLHCLSGILGPTDGSVQHGNVVISSLSSASRSKLRLDNFGFVFQDGQLIPELNARENVAIPLMLRGTSRKKALAIADRWLAKLGLIEASSRRPGEMSGGQAQRVAIARALAGEPSVIFADEPTGALDQATGHEVMQILTMSAGITGATLVVVTHDPGVAAWCNRLVEIRDGRIHADSSVSREPTKVAPAPQEPQAPQEAPTSPTASSTPSTPTSPEGTR